MAVKNRVDLFDNRRTKKIVEDNKELENATVGGDFPYLDDDLTIEKLREKGVIVLGSSFQKKRKEQDEVFFKAVPFRDGNEVRYCLTTQNLIGSLIFKGKDGREWSVSVKSRFSKTDNKQLFFLHMLTKTFDLDFGESSNAENCLLDNTIPALLFVKLLGKAADIGLFRMYQTFHHNDLRFRGKLDIPRYVLLDAITKDKIAYTTRDRSADNPLNHLILYAAEYVRRKFPSFLDADKNARELISRLKIEVTTFGTRSLAGLLTDNDVLLSLRHPYYAEYYEEIRKISLILLREENLNVFDNDTHNDDIRGFVINGAWLWEQYLFTLMKEADPRFIHSNPDTYQNPIYPFKDDKQKTFYPDFRLPVEKDDQLSSAVLDAKYKIEENASDIQQVISYILVTKSQSGYLIYPPEPNKDAPAKTDTSIGKIERYIWETEIPFISLFFPPVREFKDGTEFTEWIIAVEESFKEKMKQATKKP